MSQLPYLMREICSGMEIYFSTRTGGSYNKTSFILCDDYVELLSKLWLAEKVNGWTDTKANIKTGTLCALFQLEKLAFADPTIESRINVLLESWPRREKERRSIPKKGTQNAKHPEDLHLRLCLDWGGNEFRDALKAIFRSQSV